MKRVISLVACGALAACSCSENQWEAVDVVDYEEPIYEEQTKAPVVQNPEVVVRDVPTQTAVRPSPVYVSSVPEVVYDAPYTEIQSTPCVQATPCCQAVYYQPQPCGCGCQAMPQPVPQPKVTKTQKIITTTTTYKDCGGVACDPVVTTHEEVVPTNVSYTGYAQPAPQVAPHEEGYLDVAVETNPYNSQVIDVRPVSPKVDGKIAAKYSPEAYNVVARRATNRMLQDTSSLYGNGRTKRIFLKDTKLLSSDLPYGSQRLRGITKEIISGSETYDVINNAADADYILDSSADWYVSGSAAPALQYKLTMTDKNGRKVNEWVEIIRQLED